MKQLGCCTLCDREVFEISAYHVEPDPRAGTPKAVASPLEIAHRITYQLDNGSQMDLTFCDSCDPHAFDRIMEICIKTTLETSKRDDPIQTYIMDRTILGILYARNWTDVIADEEMRAKKLRRVA